MTTNLDNVRGRKVLVVGFGRSGQAAAQAMARLGASVTVQDVKSEDKIEPSVLTLFRNHGVEFILGKTPDDVKDFDMVIMSPGASPELPFVQAAKAAGAEITGELEIAYRITKGNYIAITGTNGKTTTTTLTGEIFRAAGRKTYVVGNIGIAVISESAVAREGDWLVTECSSFQLETTKYFCPKVSAITNITPDHLNRHHTFENYAAAKAKIFANQGPDSYCVLNMEDPTLKKLSKTCPAKVVWFSRLHEVPAGAFLKDDRITIKDEAGELHDICGVDELQIIGSHNIENALTAAAVSYFAGIDPATIGDAIRAFRGVEHRLEYVDTIHGVKYYNDSKGTNTDAATTAIRAIGHDILLIAGGDAKGQSFDEFAGEFEGRVKKLILLGRDADQIREAAEKKGFHNFIFCRDMDECVKNAFASAEEGDTVLLSPACASWDMYEDFEQRGRHFKDCVARLEK